jgi:hypothetical protein
MPATRSWTYHRPKWKTSVRINIRPHREYLLSPHFQKSRNSDGDPTRINAKKPVVYFGSFQDLLGRDAVGNIKPKNEWLFGFRQE